MKIFLLTTYYPPFLKSFYERNRIADSTFHMHQQSLLDKFFADTGATYHYLQQAGNESFLCISNCEPLQKQWAKENDVVFSEENWMTEIAFEQVKRFKPDIFYIDGVFEYFGTFARECQQYCKKIVAWISTPFHPGLDLGGISFMVSSTPDFVRQFREGGIDSGYLLPGFDTRVLQRFRDDVKGEIPFSFIGGWSHVHVNRKIALKELVAKTPLEIWGYGYRRNYPRSSWRYYMNLAFPENLSVLKRYHGEAWGLDMYSLLNRSLITFNVHESLLKGMVGNMRMFEATGMGTLLLNESAPNLYELFEPGKEIETYRNLDEAVEKVKFYLDHPDEALLIGRNARQRTIRDYNYVRFVEQLVTYFQSVLDK